MDLRMTDRAWTTRKMPRPRVVDCRGELVEYGGSPHEIRFHSEDPLPIPGDLVCVRVASAPTKIKDEERFDLHVRVEAIGDTGWCIGRMIGRWRGSSYKEYPSHG